MNTTKLYTNYITFEDFCKYIYDVIPNLNEQMFTADLTIIYNSNCDIPNSPQGRVKFFRKMLKLKGRISTSEYWITRRWENYTEKYAEFQRKGSITNKKNGVYKDRYSLKWFIDRYGAETGQQKYTDHHAYRASKLTNAAHLEKHGKSYVDNLNFLKSGRIEKFITVYGNEIGTKNIRNLFQNVRQIQLNFILTNMVKSMHKNILHEVEDEILLHACQTVIKI